MIVLILEVYMLYKVELTFFLILVFLCCCSALMMLNLLGEIMLLSSLVTYNLLFINNSFSICIIFWDSMFYLFIFLSIQSKFNSGIYSLFSGVYREYLVLILYWLPLNVLILISDFYMFV